MHCTEILIPSLKQDQVNREAFLASWPSLVSTIITTAGVGKVFSGFIISENNVNVESTFKFVLGIGMQLC